MQIYKVVVKKDCSKPIFILVNSSAGIWRTYRRFYPDSADSVSAELLNGEILVDEDVFEGMENKKGETLYEKHLKMYSRSSSALDHGL